MSTIPFADALGRDVNDEAAASRGALDLERRRNGRRGGSHSAIGDFQRAGSMDDADQNGFAAFLRRGVGMGLQVTCREACTKRRGQSRHAAPRSSKTAFGKGAMALKKSLD